MKLNTIINAVRLIYQTVLDKTILFIVGTLFNVPIALNIYFKQFHPFSVVMSSLIVLFLAGLYIVESR